VYDFPAGGGTFVIGDRSVTGTVTFWSPQWWKTNSLTNGGDTPPFKGFAMRPATPACAATWSTNPDLVVLPAAPLPDYTAGVVTDAVAKKGSTISGPTTNLEVVHVNPGYTADPSKAYTGTVVATIC